MRHLCEVGNAVASDQVLAEGESQLRRRVDELRRFDLFAQRNRLAMRVRHFNPHGGLAGDALDQDGLRLQRQAEVLREPRDPAVLDARLGLEFIGGDHRTGVNLRDAAADIELLAFLFDGARAILEVVLIDSLAALCRA